MRDEVLGLSRIAYVLIKVGRRFVDPMSSPRLAVYCDRRSGG